MRVLGTSFYYHDSAAVLIEDGRLVAAAEEERFSRRKHDPGFPANAIRYCLEAGGIAPADLDAVAFYEKPFVKFDRILQTTLATWPRGIRTFVRAMPVWLGSRLRLENALLDALPGYSKDVFYVPHHLSHAASAFLVSPFDKAAILVADGVGEWATTSVGFGEGSRVVLEREVRFPHSLGLLYSAITAYLGFRVNDAEWKVMGLAPYGKPVHLDALRKLVHVAPDGSFQLNMEYFQHHWSHKRIANEKLARLLGRPQRKTEEPLTEFHNDVARSVQALIEEILLAIGRHLRSLHDTENLCLAGGVALNSVANRRLLKEAGFKRIFVQPAAGDAGGALGCGFFAANALLGEPRKFHMDRADWGPGFSDAEVERRLAALDVAYERLPDADLVERVSRLILADRVVGWFQGRMEFGPRALGGRSILGDPRSPEMQRTMNVKIKFRESFRPFAPSVLREEVHRWFEMRENEDSPYMLLVADVLPAHRTGDAAALAAARGIDKLMIPRADIQAVTHVDHSARVQTVDAERNPLYHRLLKAFEAITGCPVIINTSFNVRGEPIVGSPRDAFFCFRATDMDVLAAGRHLLVKEDQPGLDQSAVRRHLDQFALD